MFAPPLPRPRIRHGRPALRRVRTTAPVLRRLVVLVALAAVLTPFLSARAVAQRGGQPLATTPVGTLAEALAGAAGRPEAGSAPSAGLVADGAFSVSYDAPYRSINVAADAAGGQHAIWASYADSVSPVIYAYCAPGAACESRSAWATTPIGLNGYYFLQLEVTADGRPRVMAHDATIKIPGLPFATEFRYAACETNCLSRSSWTTTALWTADNGQSLHASDFQPEYFALDAQGRPRMVYTQSIDDGEAYYAGCDANCASLASWWRRPMPAEGYDDHETADLEIGPDGRPRLLTTVYLDGETVVAYAECATAACASASAWSFSGLVTISPDGYCGAGTEGCHASLDLTPDGRPLMAIQGPTTNVVAGWCTADCLDGNNWNATGFSGIEGAEAPVAAVDAAGRFYVALQQWSAGGGLALVWCESGCTGANPSWAYLVVDPSTAIQNEFTIPPPTNCVEGDWQVGFRPSVAFLPDGQVTVGHDGEYAVLCATSGGSWSYETRWWTPRITTLASPLGVADEPGAGVPAAVALAPPAPNPTSGASAVAVTLSEAGPVTLDVLDATGRTVARVADGTMPAGTHRVALGGAGLAPGVYVVRLAAGGHVATQRLTVVQ